MFWGNGIHILTPETKDNYHQALWLRDVQATYDMHILWWLSGQEGE